MSMLRLATTFVMSIGGNWLKYCEPQSPFSSPVTHRKIIVRFGLIPFATPCAYDRATAISAADPDASSSAPLLMTSPFWSGAPLMPT